MPSRHEIWYAVDADVKHQLDGLVSLESPDGRLKQKSMHCMPIWRKSRIFLMAASMISTDRLLTGVLGAVRA